MHKANLKHIKQPHWRVLVVDFVARMVGVLAHVEGFPIGSARNYMRYVARPGEWAPDAAGQSSAQQGMKNPTTGPG